MDPADIYQKLMLDLLEDDRMPEQEELLALVAKLDQRMTHIDASHVEDQTEDLDTIASFLKKFEADFVKKKVDEMQLKIKHWQEIGYADKSRKSMKGGGATD